MLVPELIAESQAESIAAVMVAPDPASIPRAVQPGEVFALLDDAKAGVVGSGAISRLYTDFAHQKVCEDPGQLTAFWESVERDLALGLHAVLSVDYEWGVALDDAARARTASERARGNGDALHSNAECSVAARGPTEGALRVLLFRTVAFLSEAQVSTWLALSEAQLLGLDAPLSAPAPAGISDVQHSVDAAQFDDAIARIHASLARGDCYQINFTFRLTFGVFGHPLSLYRRLRARQPAGYGACICTTSGWTLSASPELFLRHQAGRLLARPMKGTAARDSDAVIDAACGATLQADPKNRAENVMIVDLLRNDLSKLAVPGGVRVTHLFAVNAWPTLWQMTSDVEAQLKPNVSFPSILRALFPCGSITGAPKHAAMSLIRDLEDTPRGLYTGAIGWIDRQSSDSDRTSVSCGDFCLSVAIRTVTIATTGALTQALAPAPMPALKGRAGIGAGIVLDSVAAHEHDECLLKARFLMAADPGFALLETLLAEGGALPYRARHIQRLASAARRLGFSCDLGAVDAALDAALVTTLHSALDTTVMSVKAPIHAPGSTALPAAGSALHRIRLTLSKAGHIECGALPALPLPRDHSGLVTVLLASDHGFLPIGPAIGEDPFLLQFKTTHRAYYDRAWQYAETKGAFDMIFANANGSLTEGARSNLLVKLDGQWFTPPVQDGLLGGVMRGVLMDDPQWRAQERRLVIADLQRAEALAVCNALRGAVPVRLVRLS